MPNNDYRTKIIHQQLINLGRTLSYLEKGYTGHPTKEIVHYYMETYMIAIEQERYV